MSMTRRPVRAWVMGGLPPWVAWSVQSTPSWPVSCLPPQDRAAGVACRGSQHRLDAHELVVLRRAVAACQAAGFDLPAIRCHGEIGDRRVLGLAGAMAHHRA